MVCDYRERPPGCEGVDGNVQDGRGERMFGRIIMRVRGVAVPLARMCYSHTGAGDTEQVGDAREMARQNSLTQSGWNAAACRTAAVLAQV